MSRRAEYEAAYFTLLRAREEHAALLRYRELLREEQDRIDAFMAALRSEPEDLPRQFRRPLEGTTKPLLEALGRRRAVILSEQDRLPERIAAQEAFVQECEAEVAALRE